MATPKYHFKDARANVDPASFIQRKTWGDFRFRGERSLEIAAQRALEVVVMATNGERIGRRMARGYAFGAAYYAWQALEVATQFYRLAAEKSADRSFVKNVEALFDFGPDYFNALVESPYASEWEQFNAPAFRYSDALDRGDRFAAVEAARGIAKVVAKFCKAALVVAPENKELCRTLAVAKSVARDWNPVC